MVFPTAGGMEEDEVNELEEAEDDMLEDEFDMVE